MFGIVSELEGCRAWCGRRPRARHHGDGGGAAGAVWRHAAAAARAHGDARRRRAGQDQRARRVAGNMQETLHIAHRWSVLDALSFFFSTSIIQKCFFFNNRYDTH